MPSSWHTASVTAHFKKGSPELCENYRPISLLQVAYKVYAMILLERLKAAGAEETGVMPRTGSSAYPNGRVDKIRQEVYPDASFSAEDCNLDELLQAVEGAVSCWSTLQHHAKPALH